MKKRMLTSPAGRRLALAGLLAGLLALGSGCTTTDYVTGKPVRNLFSLDDEVQMGGQYYADMVGELGRKDAPVNQDAARVALVREITSNIVAHAHITQLPYQATFVGDPEFVNAYALPGGHIMVFEGIWNPKLGLVRTVDELAAVVAHEIAHVNCRHSTEAITRQMLPNLLLTGALVWATLEEDDDMQLLFGGLMLVHNGLIVTRYSRRDELEADRVGMMYMARAGYDPRAAPRIWQRIARASDRQTAMPLSIFSTHPRDDLRAQELGKHLPEALALYEAAPVKRNGTRPLVP
ncbi:MAG: M48 family metallopeptidase [Kiritimatiellae bacterium]|nr:M48 family metallopeptidase [Kiritimatiellia bacterium]MDD4117238.1 M48 family metallopeptidase [Kiritimatiellia bacterium]NCC93757.1 M48 family peptidase [Opitutae bacterium]